MKQLLEPKAPSPPLRWIPEFLELMRRRLRPQARLLALSLVVGIVSGLGAVGFYASCQVVSRYTLEQVAGYRPPPPGGEAPLFHETMRPLVPWALLLVTPLGGLLSGFVIYTFAPEAEGHGTDAAITAYHRNQGRIRPQVPIIKMIASALTLGTGGSGGREGPIAQIGAGFGSFLGGVLKLRPAERRVLMAAGMGAGIGAIFKAPLAGALFASEVMYRSPDFESEVIMPAGLASVTAYCTFALFFGWNQLFTAPPDFFKLISFNDPWRLIPYTVLALGMVVLAMLYTHTFYGIIHISHRLKIRPHFRPMIGALLTAVTGVGLYYLFDRDTHLLAVMSLGYSILQNTIDMDPAMQTSLMFALVLLVVALGKILTTSLTIGSGGSAGVFGPSMVIGGCAGGALGIVVHRLWPSLAPHPVSYAILGMAGFFAAAAKTPFSTLVIVSEMTGSYSLLLPTLWVCTVSFLLSDEQSIYAAQVTSPSRSPAHQGDYVRAVLTGLDIRQFLKSGQPLTALGPGDLLPAVIDRLADSAYQALPVISSEGQLLGMVSLEEVHMASRLPELGTLVLAQDLMRTGIVPLHPDDPLDRAAELFLENDLDTLPVVDGGKQAVIGLVRRSDITSEYLRRVQGRVQQRQHA